MSRFSLLPCALLAVTLTLCAVPVAARDCGRFSADVPHGWSIVEPTDDLLVLHAPAGDAVVTVTGDLLSEQRAPNKVLESFVNYLSGDAPQKRKDRGVQFHFDHHGIRHTAIFFSDKQQYLLITVTDPAGRYPESIDMLVRSLTLREIGRKRQP